MPPSYPFRVVLKRKRTQTERKRRQMKANKSEKNQMKVKKSNGIERKQTEVR